MTLFLVKRTLSNLKYDLVTCINSHMICVFKYRFSRDVRVPGSLSWYAVRPLVNGGVL